MCMPFTMKIIFAIYLEGIQSLEFCNFSLRIFSNVDVVDFLGEHMNKYKDVKWQVVDKAIDTWYCGIGVKKGNASLQQWLNVALYTLHRADFVDETWEKWFGIRQIHSVQPQPYF